MTATITLTGLRSPQPLSQPPPSTGSRVSWLGLVAVVYAAAQLLLVIPAHLGLGWDETVYISQVDPRTPAAFFSAPRSRGISFLIAPVLAVTSSPTALRVVLALASAAALYAAFRVWQPLLGRAATALAALLFGTLWVTVLYGPQAMPNLWVALAAVAAAGWFLRTAGHTPGTPRRAYVLLAGCVAAATLFRFSDGIWLALVLLAASLLVRTWRRPAPVLAVLAGLALGSAQWIAEAYVRFGGIRQRLDAASGTEGGMHLHWNVPTAWRDLNGPLLCRPCTVHLTHTAHALWWPALLALALAACFVAVRARRPATALLPVACAATLSVPYLLLIDYFAPRFLLPAYALLALPVAALIVRMVRTSRPGAVRGFAVAALLALFAAHLGTQYADLRTNLADARATNARYQAAADDLHGLGLRPPCLVAGKQATPIAYYAGCAAANVSGNNRNTTPAALRHRAAQQPTATLTRKHHAPFYARSWIPHRLHGTGVTAYLPPRQ